MIAKIRRRISFACHTERHRTEETTVPLRFIRTRVRFALWLNSNIWRSNEWRQQSRQGEEMMMMMVC